MSRTHTWVTAYIHVDRKSPVWIRYLWPLLWGNIISFCEDWPDLCHKSAATLLQSITEYCSVTGKVDRLLLCTAIDRLCSPKENTAETTRERAHMSEKERCTPMNCNLQTPGTWSISVWPDRLLRISMVTCWSAPRCRTRMVSAFVQTSLSLCLSCP